MNSSDTAPTPASIPRTGAACGVTPACRELATTYAHLWEAIRASAARDDAEEENRLRNGAQAGQHRLRARGCPLPDPTDLEP